MDSGKRLKELRERHDLTQQQMADLIGVDRVSLTLVETGKRPMSRRFEQKVRAKFTAADVSYILGLTEWPNQAHTFGHVPFTLVPIISKRDIIDLVRVWNNKKYLDQQDKLYTRLPQTSQYLVLEIGSDELADDSKYSINDGDMVICRIIDHKKSIHISDHKFYFVITQSKYYAGRVTAVTGEEITIQPMNPMYDTQIIPHSSIKGLLKIIEIHSKRHE